MQQFWPVLIIVASNTLYHVVAKSTPEGVNPFASLLITYLTCSLACLALFFISSPDKNLAAELGKANWTSVAFSLGLIGLEVGNLFLYRVGWNISLGSLVTNICLAAVLLVLGVAVYHEKLAAAQLMGMGFCVVGLWFISR